MSSSDAMESSKSLYTRSIIQKSYYDDGDVDVCSLEPNDVGKEICSDDGTGNVVRYAYDSDINKCHSIIFDINCNSGGNIFSTDQECQQLLPRVSTDGDSHEILTLVACCSGLTVAVIVIIIIVFVMDCGNIDAAHVHRNRNRSHRLCNDIESQLNGTEICATKTIDAGNDKTKQIANENRMQIFTILDGNGETIGSQATIDRTL